MLYYSYPLCIPVKAISWFSWVFFFRGFPVGGVEHANHHEGGEKIVTEIFGFKCSIEEWKGVHP